MDLDELAGRVHRGEVDGHGLKSMVEKGELTKTDRRRIGKLVTNLEKLDKMTPRQRHRQEVKQKKALPKLSKEERKRRYHDMLESEREAEAAKFTTCLGCRKRGHFVKDCPKLSLADRSQYARADSEYCQTASNDRELCFNCGSRAHSLRNCTEPRIPGQLPFASCFVCRGTGHISRDCPQNAHGLYPQGGCCHICQLRTHLARDCPHKPTEEEVAAEGNTEVEKEDGVRVKGLSSKEAPSSADALGDDDFDVSESEDEDAPSKKKSKKSRSGRR